VRVWISSIQLSTERNVSICELGTGTSGSINCWKYIDQLRGCCYSMKKGLNSYAVS
jgi:hypothetical protein